jgi:hypothetical protein
MGANVALFAAAISLSQRFQRPRLERMFSPRTEMAAGVLLPQISAPSAELPLTPLAVAKLGRVGIPRDTVAAVIIADLDLRSARALLALQKQHAPKPVPEREQIELSRWADDEQKRELETAFGEEGYRSWDREQTILALNPSGVSMTDEEAEKVYDLQKAFDQKNQALIEAMQDGVADKADGRTLQAQAQAALDRELKSLLGNDRFDSLRGRGPEARYADAGPPHPDS